MSTDEKDSAVTELIKLNEEANVLLATVAEDEAESVKPETTAADSKRMRKQQEHFAKMFADYQAKQRRSYLKVLSRVRVLKEEMGADDFNVLKDICTVRTPEVKNEAGEVTQEAKSQVNYQALLAEGRLVIALNRESRIKAGLRKRSSGNTSTRRNHSIIIKFIEARNKVASSEPVNA